MGVARKRDVSFHRARHLRPMDGTGRAFRCTLLVKRCGGCSRALHGCQNRGGAVWGDAPRVTTDDRGSSVGTVRGFRSFLLGHRLSDAVHRAMLINVESAVRVYTKRRPGVDTWVGIYCFWFQTNEVMIRDFMPFF